MTKKLTRKERNLVAHLNAEIMECLYADPIKPLAGNLNRLRIISETEANKTEAEIQEVIEGYSFTD